MRNTDARTESAESAPANGGHALPGELPASIVAGVLLLVSFVFHRVGLESVGAPVSWASLLIGLVYGGNDALRSLLQRRFDIDALMVLAAALAAYIGQVWDGALLLFLFTLSGALEERALQRTMRAVEALHKLMPTVAQAWRDGAWVECDPGTLKRDERVRVRTGEFVPADARVETGATSIDQSALTGESMPRAVEPGDELFAGTINLDHPIEAVVLRPASESSLQRILDLVIEAQQQREPIQRVIDRLSQPYAIGVTAISAAVGLAWWGLIGLPFVGDGTEPDALTTAITLLIVASPCALVIATPTATLAAISRAARGGVLFKGGQSIERLARIRSVCMDKTGTLTFGRPRLTQVHPVAWSEGSDLLAVAAALEAGSTHPIADAVREAAAARAIGPFDAEGLTNTPGRGLSGAVNGREARLGTYEHAAPLVPVCLRNRVQEVLERARSRGQIGVVVAWSGSEPAPQGDAPPDSQAAVMVMSDTIRPGAKALVERLGALGVRPVRMLTGDNHVTAAYVAGQLGIEAFDAELLPQDKVRILGEMRAEGRGVAVIGDGVNDAPALAAADVSIAIGSIGSDAALESADIVLLNDDLGAVPWAVRLARRCRGIVAFNLIAAMGIIVFMAALTITGSLTGMRVPLPWAVIAHEGGTLLVVLNSLRLLVGAGAPASEPVPREREAPVSAELIAAR